MVEAQEQNTMFAPGIPDKHNLGDLLSLASGNIYDYILHEHAAERAGLHADLRLGNEKVGLFSWAIPKGRLPKPGEKFLAVQQPLHSYDYGSFTGIIEKGYGKGRVTIAASGKVLVTEVDPALRKVAFTVISERHPQRYLLLRPTGSDWSERDWLVLNVTPRSPLEHEKQSLPNISPDRWRELLQKRDIVHVQPKIDGALVFVVLSDSGLDIYSHRVSRATGAPIIHTERVFGGRPKIDIPNVLDGTVLLGELYGVQKMPDGTEKVIPPNVLSAILNSAPYNALMRLRRDGIDLRVGLFDIRKFGDNLITYDMPYEDRRAALREVIRKLNIPKFGIIPGVDATKLDLVNKLWEQIVNGKHPLTSEGIVLYPKSGIPYKVKAVKETDVYIRRIERGEGKYKDSAGGFAYSREPNGPIVGTVGTGFDDEMRQDMWDDPGAYIGRRARIKYFEEYPSGALRAPVFIALHEDYPSIAEKNANFEIFDEHDPRWLEAVHYLMLVKNGSVGLTDLLAAPAFEWPIKLNTSVQALLGGPNPLTAMLIYGGLLSAVSYGLGLLIEGVFDHRIEGLAKKMAIVGGILGAAVPFTIHGLPNIKEFGLKGLFVPSPLQRSLLEASKGVKKLSSLFEYEHGIQFEIPARVRDCIQNYMLKNATKFDVDKWGKEILSEDRFTPWEKTMLVTIPLVTSVRTGDDWVTVGDIVKTTVNMNFGRFLGEIIGNTASTFLSIKPELREEIKNTGKLVGFLKSVLKPVRQSAIEIVAGERSPYEEIRKTLHI